MLRKFQLWWRMVELRLTLVVIQWFQVVQKINKPSWNIYLLSNISKTFTRKEDEMVLMLFWLLFRRFQDLTSTKQKSVSVKMNGLTDTSIKSVIKRRTQPKMTKASSLLDKIRIVGEVCTSKACQKYTLKVDKVKATSGWINCSLGHVRAQGLSRVQEVGVLGHWRGSNKR